MALTEAEVRHIARLARLELSADELTRMTSELDRIVGYVEQLREVDTHGVDPVAQVTGLVNIEREDTPGPMFDRQTVLGNAALANDQAFLVPKAVER
ncbi:MAG: Asp-tRNA(Asn)/Glu-tRNA(Gln) amidotransferase subunit GatC [Planctomycetota bacterium]